jgi:transposase
MTITGPDWLAEAKQMRLDGKTYKQIAAILGRSENVVSKTFRRYKINIEVVRGADMPPPSWVDRAMALQRRGNSWKSIAAELDVGVHLVRKEIDPGYAEYRAQQNRDYMDRGGWSMRKEREKRANELAEKQAAESPKASAGMLAAGRFMQPNKMRYGR